MRHRVVELACRWYVFIFLNIYGFGKIFGGQFYRRGRLPDEVANMTLESADAYSLAWTFMGYSYGYILFIGISQLLGAWFLLFKKTKLIGVLILVPILVNVIVFDIFFLDQKGALASACIYCLLLLAILYLNRPVIVKVLKALTFSDNYSSKQEVFIQPKHALVALVLMGLLFLVDQGVVNLLGY